MIASFGAADYSVELEGALVSVSVDLTLCRNLSGLARYDQTSTNAADQHLLFLRSLAAGYKSTCFFFFYQKVHATVITSSDQGNF